VGERELEALIALAFVLGITALVYLVAWLVQWADTAVAPQLYNQLSSMGVLGTVVFYLVGIGAVLGAIAAVTAGPLLIAVALYSVYYRVSKRPRINYFEWLYITTHLDIYLRALGDVIELQQKLKCSERKRKC